MNENKEIMANNIKHYMNIQKVSATEICKALDIKQNTFSDWVNAKTYPRIDKIEKMANYFGISKAQLVESHLSRPKISTLSDEEITLIENYRRVDEIAKSSIKRILAYSLGLNEVIKNGDSKKTT